MHLRYINKLGIPKDIELTGEPLSIGRSREADIPLLDDKTSRVHCGIRLSDGEFYIKDLKSRNGTFVNGQRIEDTVKIKAGDRIQIGSTVFVLEDASLQEDAVKSIDSVQGDMEGGKGYTTILKEIVEDIEPPATRDKSAAPKVQPSTSKPSGRPTIKIGPSFKTPTTPKAEPAAPAQPPAAQPAAPGRKKIIIKR